MVPRLAIALLVLPLLLSGADPVVNSIVNSASFTPAPLPGSAVAQGSIVAIFGSALGPSQFRQSGYPLKTDMDGVAIAISAGGMESKAFILYVAPNQLGAVISSDTPVGTASARVTFNGKTSPPFSFEVTKAAPGLFTLNTAGNGPAVVTTPDYRPIDYANAALEGDTLSVWATGLGPLLNGDPDNVPAAYFDPPRFLEVLVGGKPAAVRYKGRAPDLSGVDQIVFDMPSGVSGCNVTLLVRAAGVPSNYTTIAVGTNRRVCSEPHGLSAADLTRGAQAGLRIGSVSLNRTRTRIFFTDNTVNEQRIESGAGIFLRYDNTNLFRSRGLDLLTFGNCTVHTFQGQSPPGDAIQADRLSVGTTISMAAPSGMGKRIDRGGNGAYATEFSRTSLPPTVIQITPPFTLDPGQYMLSAVGGADVGAFSTALALPDFLTSNLASINSVSRPAGVNVAWQSGNPANEFVTISGVSLVANPAVGAQFVCMERAAAGRFAVPAEVLQALPPSGTASGGGPMGLISVTASPLTGQNRFTAPGLDVGIGTYNFTDTRLVSYR